VKTEYYNIWFAIHARRKTPKGPCPIPSRKCRADGPAFVVEDRFGPPIKEAIRLRKAGEDGMIPYRFWSA
jgi:hypothetical protein